MLCDRPDRGLDGALAAAKEASPEAQPHSDGSLVVYDIDKRAVKESPQLLFVYGTLRRGHENRFARLLWSRAEDLGAATTAGRLYSLGLYGGLVEATTEGQVVHGQVAQLKVPALLVEFDRYEGPSYERVLRRVVLANGEVRDAWLYRYRGSLAGARRVESGRWPLK